MPATIKTTNLLDPSSATTNIQLDSSGNVYLVPTSGNVGIGTTSPTYKLEVSGSGGVSGIRVVNGYAAGLTIANATSGSVNRLLIGQSASAAYIYTDAPAGVAPTLPLFIVTGKQIGRAHV